MDDHASSQTDPNVKEYTVRLPKVAKSFNVMKFSTQLTKGFSKWGAATMKRDLSEKKLLMADSDSEPEFGAGSEYGRKEKKQRRKILYGKRKMVNIEKWAATQPWTLQIGDEKRVFTGKKQAGITENTSYYIFTQCADGVFEAFPVDNWYNFTPNSRYKVLSTEEAEELFTKRHKQHNHFQIMYEKRLKDAGMLADDEGGDNDSGEQKKGRMQISDFDDSMMHDDDNDNESDEDSESSKSHGDKTKKASKKKPRKKKGNSDAESEAADDSGDGDKEGQEIDYISSDSSDEEIERELKEGIEKGVDEAIQSNSDEDEENSDKKSDEKDPSLSSDISSGEQSDGDSSSSEIRSLVNKPVVDTPPVQAVQSPSVSKVTPVTPLERKSVQKKEGQFDDAPPAKRMRTDSPVPGSVTEDNVRKYLLRKPITTKELITKFKKSDISKDDLVKKLVEILKRINPIKENIKGTMHLSLRK